MPEVVIKYKTKRTLQALKDFAKYFDFSMVQFTEKSTNEMLNGVTIVRGDSRIDVSELKKVFTGKKIVAKELRSEAWQRKK